MIKNFIMLLLIVLFSSTLTPQVEIINSPADIPKQSSLFSSSVIQNVPSPAIEIHSNAEFIAKANSEGWTGNGTASNPYIIDGLDIVSETWYGINIWNVDLHFQISNCFLKNMGQSLILSNVAHCKLINNTVVNSYWGIWVSHSYNINITNNTIMNGGNAVYFRGSFNCTISHNTIFNNSVVGIWLEESNKTVITSNSVSNNCQSGRGGGHSGSRRDGGIKLSGSCNISLIDNFVHENFYGGINTGGSFHISYINNTIFDNTDHGIYLGYLNQNTFTHNIVSNNTGVGISFYHSYNNSLFNNLIINNSEGGIGFSESWNNTLSANNLTRNGLIIDGEAFETYSQNGFEDNFVNGKPLIFWEGIRGGSILTDAGQIILINVTGVEITGQNISFASCGLLVAFCKELNIHDNTFTNNSNYGIALFRSSNNIIQANNLMGKGIAFYGEKIEDWLQSSIVDNLINGRPLIYWQNTIGGTIPPNAEQIILVNVSDAEITGQIITYTSYGLIAAFCKELNIHNNVFNYNKFTGISLLDSSNVTLENNEICKNIGYGVWIDNSAEVDLIDLAFMNNSDGIWLNNSFNIFFTNITVMNNNNEGMEIQNSCNITINNSIVSKNNIKLNLCNYSLIIDTYVNNSDLSISESWNNTFSNNIISFSRIDLRRSCCNIFTANLITNNTYTGIGLVFSHNNVFTNNSIINNDEGGIYLDDSRNNTLISNTIASNNGVGIEIGQYYPWYPDEPSSSNFIINNIISNNQKQGIAISDYAFNNIISWNSFVGNNPGSTYQARDSSLGQSISNNFNHNYWDDWVDPDVNADGIVDKPYILAGSARNQDNYPLVKPFFTEEHALLPPTIISPNGREILENMITITWIPSHDTHFHSIKYSIYYSSDAGTTWTMLEEDIVGTEYVWDIRTFPSSSFYMIKVIAFCSEGLNATDISDELFSIVSYTENPTIPSTSKPATGPSSLLMMTLFVIYSGLRRKKSRKLIKLSRYQKSDSNKIG